MRKFLVRIFVLSFLILVLSACSESNNIVGRYVADWDEKIYYEMKDDGTYITNNLMDGLEDSGKGKYDVDANSYITTFINSDEKWSMGIGYLYKDTICSIFVGEIPNGTNKVELVSADAVDVENTWKIFFDDDKYRYVFVSNNQEFIISTGTFRIDGKNIICNPTEGQNVHLFIDSEKLYSVEYRKAE